MAEGRRASDKRSMYNESSREYQIPGYYFDGATGRYFRIPSSGAPEPQISKIVSNARLEKRKELIQPRDPALKHLPDFLMRRQLDCRNNAFFEKDLLKMKTMNLKLSETLDFSVTHCPNFKEVVYLKGTEYSLLVEFNVQEVVPLVNGSSVTEVYHPYTPAERRQPRFSNFVVNKHISVNDMCVGFKDDQYLMFVGNNFKTKTGITQIVSRSLDRRDIMFRNYTSIYPIYSCCSNNVTEKFAHGLQAAFSVITVTGSLQYTKQKGNVHGITFNKQGNLVFCALHNGKFSINDLRSPESVIYKKVDKTGLDEVVLTADENNLICGGFDGLLCKFDLRTHRKVIEYVGHAHTPCKVPFSISEPHNLLCATGCDNITMLWSLTEGGEPLNYILPEIEGPICRSCLITDGSKVSVCVTQKQKALLYDIFT